MMTPLPHLMKNLFIALSLTTIATASLAQQSAFSTVRFGNAVQVDLPRSWTYLDPAIAAHLNTSSEAQPGAIGLPVPQGNNVILAAANAYDSAGKTRATLRVSVRTEQGATQTQIREFARRPKAEIEATLRPAAEATVKAMLQMPNVKSYKLAELRIDTEGPLTCMLTRFEGDYGGRLVVADTWVCPNGDKSIKLSTSYEKALKHIYAPTLDQVRRSLSTPAER